MTSWKFVVFHSSKRGMMRHCVSDGGPLTASLLLTGRSRSCVTIPWPTNHGGVAAVTVPGVWLGAINLDFSPTSFEFVCVSASVFRLVRRRSSIVGLIYKPGSTLITSVFFDEMSDLLDQLSTFVEPIFVGGDVNICVDRLHDQFRRRAVYRIAGCAWSRLSCDVFDACLSNIFLFHGTNLPALFVAIIDVGLSDALSTA